MGGLRPKNKAVSSVPKEFLPYIREGLGVARDNLSDPFRGIQEGSARLGITPGVNISDTQKLGTNATKAALPNIAGLFSLGSNQQAGTIRGDYLDPTKVDAFKRYEDSIRATGANTFNDLLDSAHSRMAMRGNLNSSARTAGDASAAARVATDTNAELARLGADIYSRERGYQEGAAGKGVAGLPDIAQQLFGQGDTLTRLDLLDDAAKLELANGIAQLSGVPIQQITSLIGALGGQNTQNPSGGQMALSAVGGLLNPAQGVFGGGS